MAPVNKICLSSNDAFLLVSCEDETIRVFSLIACRELHFLQFQEGKVRGHLDLLSFLNKF